MMNQNPIIYGLQHRPGAMTSLWPLVVFRTSPKPAMSPAEGHKLIQH